MNVTVKRRAITAIREFLKPHKAVAKDTVARCIKSILQKSGIDTAKFTSHSTRAQGNF